MLAPKVISMLKISASGTGEIFIDFVAPDTRINDIQLGVPVSINIENGVAAMALGPPQRCYG